MISKLCAFLFAIFLFCPVNLFSSAVYSVTPAAFAQNSPRTGFSPLEVRNYVLEQSRAVGVNSRKALWIVDHESQDGRNMVGHEPNGSTSWGYWQFNNRNAGFNKDCAMNLECSTKLAMNWILAGKIDAWTTYSQCRAWYPDTCPF